MCATCQCGNYTAILSGSYTVVVTNSDACQSTSQPAQVFITSERLIIKGLNEKDDLIKFYPNPLYRSDFLNIEWSEINLVKGLLITVSDITKRLIETRLLESYERKIGVKGARGVYTVEVSWGTKSI